MKTWKKYAGCLMEGEWHVHTSYTDGSNTVAEYCRAALEKGIPLLAFTEHVRKKTDYDFDRFLRDIHEARKSFDLIILSGCEAKVLPGGELDVDQQLLKEVDYPVFAFHSFPDDPRLYLESLEVVLRNQYINTWAHPGPPSGWDSDLSDKELFRIFQLMKNEHVLLEINRKHLSPPPHWLSLADNCNIIKVRGSDIHCVDDLVPQVGRHRYR